MYDYIIRNARVIDGTGGDAYPADVAIRGDRIAAIGALSGPAGAELDADGAVLAPGFIDAHTHADLSWLFFPTLELYLMQGVTTVVGGNCGHAMAPLGPEIYRSAVVDVRAMYRARPSYFGQADVMIPRPLAEQALRETCGIQLDWSSFSSYLARCERAGLDGNLVPLAGYSAIRTAVLGADCCRPASGPELTRLEEAVRGCMEEGAFGLSTGMDPQYIPGPFATREELLRVLRVVRDWDGVYTSHTSNVNAAGVLDRMDGYRQMLEVALEASVRAHVSHVHTLGMGAGPEEYAESARQTLRYFEHMERQGLELTYDVIPSPCGVDFTAADFCYYFTPFVLMSGGKQQFLRNLRTPDFREMVRQVVKSGMYPPLDPAEPMSIYHYVTVQRHRNRDCEGKNLMQLAAAAGRDPLELTMRLYLEDPSMAGAMEMTGMEEATRILCRHRLAVMSSDGMSGRADSNIGIDRDLARHPSPMNAGAAVRFIAVHGHPRLEDTIYHMTGLPARIFRLEQRGILREGAYADLVLFRPERLHSYDQDPARPLHPPEGISHVFVNGVLTVQDRKHLGRRAGRVLRHRPGSSPAAQAR